MIEPFLMSRLRAGTRSVKVVVVLGVGMDTVQARKHFRYHETSPSAVVDAHWNFFEPNLLDPADTKPAVVVTIFEVLNLLRPYPNDFADLWIRTFGDNHASLRA